MRTMLFVLLAGVLASTSAWGGRYNQGISSITLKTAITIPRNNAHLTFQHGKGSTGANLFETHCEFQVNLVSKRPQTVHPGRFTVTRANQRVVSDELSGAFGNIFNCNEPRFYEVHLWLSDPQQPNVRKMICRNGYPYCGTVEFPNRTTISEALGHRFTVE
ncbi:MAG: hypothetical protein ABFR19_06330 [Pseudomonadota bacterium]